jgi:hypothetical protein
VTLRATLKNQAKKQHSPVNQIPILIEFFDRDGIAAFIMTQRGESK